ncbi:hypothetical protein BO78DRAFT_73629 [Aspergillus sclerotiicarbonarius CBS 121057]|uniref:Uncharacterized protein n=1 Tax=Aspergillus sclerotiicarbonarius (strain CBS 121057 / IBT 28362) TaxID=1448318 RepID=A0A319FK89_ASPSB|nr:hypothetical protein BO78DRAFT_73629 [Aspergillus sclerotiicarbonarius CBS 121057]
MPCFPRGPAETASGVWSLELGARCSVAAEKPKEHSKWFTGPCVSYIISDFPIRALLWGQVLALSALRLHKRAGACIWRAVDKANKSMNRVMSVSTVPWHTMRKKGNWALREKTEKTEKGCRGIHSVAFYATGWTAWDPDRLATAIRDAEVIRNRRIICNKCGESSPFEGSATAQDYLVDYDSPV